MNVDFEDGQIYFSFICETACQCLFYFIKKKINFHLNFFVE